LYKRYMRRFVLAFVLFLTVMGWSLVSCDLLNTEVLLDDTGRTTVTDSTTIRVLSSVPDSTQLIINTSTSWHADVAKGGEWCTLSKHDGSKGRDTILVRVEENTAVAMRQTSIVIESGNTIRIFKVNQMAGEGWIEVPYWKRTALQRMGLHGKVQMMTVSDNWHPNESSTYFFDEEGNLLSEKSMDSVANQYDVTRLYEYDEANHRLMCTVKDWKDRVVRKLKYEYKNQGKLVAFSAKGWEDPDPLSEDMEGMVIPDLSAVHKTWLYEDEEYHEDRTYTFEDENRLVIYIDRWRDSADVHVSIGCDTMRVSYQYINSCMLNLPYTSRGYVKNSVYYSTGMLKMMETMFCKYDFLNNVQKMVVTSFQYTGDPSATHNIDSYVCEYNDNRDLVERTVHYTTSAGITIERYPQYQYDECHNWTVRLEEQKRSDSDDVRPNLTKREFIYYR